MPLWTGLPRPYLFLAPMAGVADWPHREICYRFGAELTVSPLIPVGGLFANPTAMIESVGARHEGRPFIAQLLGREPQDFRRAAQMLCDASPIVGIDINMGCPAAAIVRSGCGAALLREHALAAAIVAEARAGSRLPVSVKVRLGWDGLTAVDLAPLLQRAGAEAIFVHGRTRLQQYRGSVDLAAIAAIKRAVTIPVIGNGDVTSLEKAQHMLAATEVDGIMIGRGAVGNPWLFAELQASLKGCDNYLRRALPRGEVIRLHASLAFADQGARAARTIRKHLVGYSRGSPYSARLRHILERLSEWRDIEEWIETLDPLGAARWCETALTGVGGTA